jgi:hypothetical protein
MMAKVKICVCFLNFLIDCLLVSINILLFFCKLLSIHGELLKKKTNLNKDVYKEPISSNNKFSRVLIEAVKGTEVEKHLLVYIWI